MQTFFDRKLLLASVSAAALTFSWGGQALAADPVELDPVAVEPARFGPAPEVWVAVEGRYNIFNDGLFELDPFYSPTLDPTPDDGWSGGLELGARPGGSQWDYVGRFIYGKADGGDSDFYSSYPFYGSSEASVEEEHILADFEVGRHIGIGLGDTRIHAGLRFAHFDARVNGSSYYSYYYYGYGGAVFNGDQTITAIGPRIGIDQKIPVTENLSVDLSAAGAVLFGKRDSDASVGYYGSYGYGGFTGSSSESVTVWNAEASGGLTYQFGQASATLGYRVDVFKDLYDFDGGESDRVTHGPFAKIRINLSGGS